MTGVAAAILLSAVLATADVALLVATAAVTGAATAVVAAAEVVEWFAASAIVVVSTAAVAVVAASAVSGAAIAVVSATAISVVVASVVIVAASAAATATSIVVSVVVAVPVIVWSPVLAAWAPFRTVVESLACVYSDLRVPPCVGCAWPSFLAAWLTVTFRTFNQALLSSFPYDKPFQILLPVFSCQLCVSSVRLVPQLLFPFSLTLCHIWDHCDILVLCV